MVDAAEVGAFHDAVEDYSKAMDVFANSSAILCPLWGSVRILLHVSHELICWCLLLIPLFRLPMVLDDTLTSFRICSLILEIIFPVFGCLSSCSQNMSDCWQLFLLLISMSLRFVLRLKKYLSKLEKRQVCASSCLISQNF